MSSWRQDERDQDLGMPSVFVSHSARRRRRVVLPGVRRNLRAVHAGHLGTNNHDLRRPGYLPEVGTSPPDHRRGPLLGLPSHLAITGAVCALAYMGAKLVL